MIITIFGQDEDKIRYHSGKIIALFITIIVIVEYYIHLLQKDDPLLLGIICVAVSLCGHYYDKHLKLEESLQKSTIRSFNIEETCSANFEHSITGRKDQNILFQQRLLSVLENTLDCVGITELTGRCVYMNRSLRTLLEIDDEYPSDKYMFEWHSKDNRLMLMEVALPSAVKYGLWTGESCLLTKTGKEIPVVLTISAHKDQEGKTEYYSTTIRLSSTIRAEEEAKLSRLLLWRTMQVQENDRHKLAQELHDGLGQSLYSIMLGMQYLQGKAEGDQNKQLLQQWIDELHKALSIVKLFSIQLRPHTLDQLGLSPAIEQLVARIRALDNGLKVTYKTNMALSQRFNEEIEICLYRIIQEALHNSLKHANAANVEIVLEQEDRAVKLFIKDDGSGFLREKEKEGLGLRHMEERAYALHGTIDIHSIVRIGTTINVEIPLKEHVR